MSTMHLIVPASDGGYQAQVVDMDTLESRGEPSATYPTISALIDALHGTFGPNGFQVREDIAGRK